MARRRHSWFLTSEPMDAALGSRALNDVEEASFEEVSEKTCDAPYPLPQRLACQSEIYQRAIL